MQSDLIADIWNVVSEHVPEKEKQEAIKKLRGKPEITRFKGLGEISPNEFEDFIRNATKQLVESMRN